MSLFPFDDAKVQRFFIGRIIFHQLLEEKSIIIDTNQVIVLAHNHFSILFVSSTNSGIDNCSGRFVNIEEFSL